LYAYRKVIDTVTTHTLRLPEATQGEQAGQELATLADGRTVVVLFDAFSLPGDQPSAIAASIEALPPVLSDLLREQIKAASPHVALISQRMIDQIRASYTQDDENYFSRIGVGAAMGMYTPSSDEIQAMTVFGEFVEAVRQWGRAERAKLGL
jgi:hypothetical protein